MIVYYKQTLTKTYMTQKQLTEQQCKGQSEGEKPEANVVAI